MKLKREVKTGPLISVIVPVYNGGPQLGRCLDALLASGFRDYEILLVDDCSTDESALAAGVRGVQVVRLGARLGPGAARNRGAVRARGSILLFIDADVVVRRNTLAHVAAVFRERPNLAALFGSYDDAPAGKGFVSQYKNLLHHFVHQRSAGEAATFWAGCGAVRREAFEAAGGFDEVRFKRPSIEDIELGHRLRRRGCEIMLDGELLVQHLKRWTLSSLLRADIFDRALPWSRLIVEDGAMIENLNLRAADRACGALALLSLLALFLSCFYWSCLCVTALSLAAVFVLNLRFYSFLKARRGQWFALRAFGMLALYYVYSASVFGLVYCAHVLRKAGRFMRLGQRVIEAERANDA